MNQYKALMAGFAAVIGLGGVAAYNGAFSVPTIIEDTALAGKTPVAPASAQPAKTTAATNEVAKPDAASTDISKANPTVSNNAALSAPTFDVLRVESNGSVVIAGRSAKDAQVEVMSGVNILGATKAGPNGDFAIAVDTQLKAGDYQLVLRQTLPDGSAATSVETAIVSVPEKLNGPVLALVEEPGKPSRIITTPNAAEVTVQAQVTNPSSPADPAKPAEAAKPANGTEASKSAESKTTRNKSAVAEDGSVKIDAVEIEGDKIFVSGAAKGVSSVRVYANDQVLGDAKPLANERFALEIQTELKVGDYIIKAEGLADDGVTVLGRSTVPFTRAGENDVAVAPVVKTPATAPQDQSADPSVDITADKKMAVVIRRGDTLWQISRRIYGRGVRYSTIYLANKDAILNPNKIFPGQVVAIPEKTEEGVSANADELKKRESAQ